MRGSKYEFGAADRHTYGSMPDVARMRTNNDSKNGPMLAVNRKLGNVPSPSSYQLLKKL